MQNKPKYVSGHIMNDCCGQSKYWTWYYPLPSKSVLVSNCIGRGQIDKRQKRLTVFSEFRMIMNRFTFVMFYGNIFTVIVPCTVWSRFPTGTCYPEACGCVFVFLIAHLDANIFPRCLVDIFVTSFQFTYTTTISWSESFMSTLINLSPTNSKIIPAMALFAFFVLLKKSTERAISGSYFSN